jgi:hypothetical protein
MGCAEYSGPVLQREIREPREFSLGCNAEVQRDRNFEDCTDIHTSSQE